MHIIYDIKNKIASELAGSDFDTQVDSSTPRAQPVNCEK